MAAADLWLLLLPRACTRIASLRSVSFLAGIGIIFKLFISSAYALSENQTWL